MNWKLVGSATGTTRISLPDNWSELLIYAVDKDYQQAYTFNVVKGVLDLVTSNRSLIGGGYNTNASYWMGVNVSDTEVWLSSATANGGTDRKASVTVRVYYK